MIRLSARQVEVLHIIGEDGADGWGEVFTHYDAGPGALEFVNFGRVAEALERKQLVVADACTGEVALSDAGIRALVSHPLNCGRPHPQPHCVCVTCKEAA